MMLKEASIKNLELEMYEKRLNDVKTEMEETRRRMPPKKGVSPRWEQAPDRSAPPQSAARSSQPLSTPSGKCSVFFFWRRKSVIRPTPGYQDDPRLISTFSFNNLVLRIRRQCGTMRRKGGE